MVLTKMKALIVEDDYISRTLLSEYLAPYAVCDAVADGHAALHMLTEKYKKNERYDLVCLDIMMPGMDGHEVLNWLRRIEHEQNIVEEESAKVFMTTALDDPQSIMNAFTLGRCQAYLMKPILRERLVEHLHEFLLPH